MDKKKLAIAIPASVVSDTPHLREKTAKIGLIGRTAAIFRVDEIIVYPDDPKVDQTGEVNLIGTLLAYMETPQYLRKRRFKLEPQLRYAGILPPLRTPHHPLNRKMNHLKVGEYREGVTLSKTKEGTLVDIGVEKPVLILNKQSALNLRVTVKVVKVDGQAQVEMVNRGEIQEYWGYTVTIEKHSLGELVRSRGFDLTIATSKYGDPVAAVVEGLTKKLKEANTILVEFGAPTKGLSEIVRAEGLRLSDIADFVVNTIPMQGTATVRTEEALIASLAIFNMQFVFKV